MKALVAVLETGIVLTTPIFFLVTLIVLWRILRAVDNTVAIAIHVKRQIEVLSRGGLPEAVRATSEVRQAEQRQYRTEDQDEDRRG